MQQAAWQAAGLWEEGPVGFSSCLAVNKGVKRKEGGLSYLRPQPTGVPPHFTHAPLALHLGGQGVGFAEV